MKAEQIKHLLPGVVQAGACPGSPMAALLDAMEALHQPAEDVVESIATYFNPHAAPDAFVPFLARWVDIDRFFPAGYSKMQSATPLSSGMGRLRELVQAAAYLSQWRGTCIGLTRFLETATGMKGFTIEEHTEDRECARRPFHLCITAPADARIHRALIERIIGQEKPAYVTYELNFENDNPENR
jgi:phage tail-like protein